MAADKRMWLWLCSLILFGASATLGWAGGTASVVPPAFAPGAINPAVTQDNIQQTICRPDWTRSIRPPAAYTDELKRQQLQTLGYADQNPAHYEEDHRISLEVGGAPTDTHNLWPEPYAGPEGARVKDQLEDKLHKLVCGGKMTLSAAQAVLQGDWLLGYHRYVKP